VDAACQPIPQAHSDRRAAAAVLPRSAPRPVSCLWACLFTTLSWSYHALVATADSAWNPLPGRLDGMITRSPSVEANFDRRFCRESLGLADESFSHALRLLANCYHLSLLPEAFTPARSASRPTPNGIPVALENVPMGDQSILSPYAVNPYYGVIGDGGFSHMTYGTRLVSRLDGFTVAEFRRA